MSASLPVKVAYIDGSKTTYLTYLLTGLTWSGDLATAGRSVTVTLRNTLDDGDTKLVDKMELGKKIICWKRDKKFFTGYIFTKSVDNDGTVTLEAHESPVYLAKNKDSKKFVRMTAKAIIIELCNQYGIEYGHIDDTGYVIPKLIFRQKTLWEMVQTALTETRKKTNKIYLISVEDGKLALRERKTQAIQLVISDGTNLMGASYKESIEDLRNSVKVTGKSGEDAKGASTSNSDSIKKYGTMREIQHEGELLDNELKAIADALLKELNQVTKEFDVSAIGDTSAIAGKSVKVYERMTEITGGFYISADSHTFTPDGVHRMDLTLSRTLDVEWVDYEDPEETGADTGGGDYVGGFQGDLPTASSTWLHHKITSQTKLSTAQVDYIIKVMCPSNSLFIDCGKFFIEAANKSNLDVIYILAHAFLESGYGTSNIARNKFNFFGIGAFDASPYLSSHQYGGVQAGLVEGACWIARNYPQGKWKQDTVYKMRFNNGVHQYATDKNWANKLANLMGKIASKVNFYNDTHETTKSSTSGVASEAKKYIGKLKYSFGGNNISGGSGDCSAFTQHIFKTKAGIDIGRNTATQVTKGTKVSKDDAKAGDLIFFQGTYRSGVSHVGIVTSKGKFVHLSSSGCMESSYTSGYWASHFMQIRRIS